MKDTSGCYSMIIMWDLDDASGHYNVIVWDMVRLLTRMTPVDARV